MTEDDGFVKRKWAHAQEWLCTHPKTGWYLVFFLGLNYFLDLIPYLF